MITLGKCKHLPYQYCGNQLFEGTNAALDFFFYTSVLSYFLLCTISYLRAVLYHFVPSTVAHVEQVYCKEMLLF